MMVMLLYSLYTPESTARELMHFDLNVIVFVFYLSNLTFKLQGQEGNSDNSDMIVPVMTNKVITRQYQ